MIERIAFAASLDELVRRFGAPHACDEDPLPGLGLGDTDVWNLVFPCGTEAVLLYVRGRSLGVVMSRDDDVDHLWLHLELAARQVDPWLPTPPARWAVWRQDDNGHRFQVAVFSSERGAQCACDAFEDSGHKQTYWIEPLPAEAP